MTNTDTKPHHPHDEFEEDTRPLVAPCHTLEMDAPLRWLKQGIGDFRRAPDLSLLYGFFLTLASWFIAAWAWYVGSFTIIIVLFGGFVFLGPALAMGLYSVSCQLERREKPRMLYCLRQGLKRLGNQMIFAFVLLIVFLVWARAASMVHIFMPMESGHGLGSLLTFLGVGSIVGSVFALVVFCAGAFSLPMMMDRDVDAITAMITSFNAVLSNKKPMLIWGLIILGAILFGFLTGFIGLMVTLPVIGYATWRGYRETIIADDWPQDPETQVLQEH
ncbi:MAG: DUF2189 domain-containing protein [Thiolinea sp.]